MVADFKANQSRVSFCFPVAILKQAADIYTPAVYKLFYEELYRAYDCRVEDSREIGTTMKYMVSPPMKKFSFVVSYDSKDETFCCTYRKFEFAGLILPNKYILRRWTKDAKKGSISNTITQAAESDDGYLLVKECLLILLGEIDASSIKRQMQSSLQSSQYSQGYAFGSNGMMEEVRGLKVKPKENGTSKRRKSALEVATNKRRHKKNTKQHTTPSQAAQRFTTSQSLFKAHQQLEKMVVCIWFL
ncbi:hypothetical protein V2J09_021352 [Rumex salicifolius]